MPDKHWSVLGKYDEKTLCHKTSLKAFSIVASDRSPLYILRCALNSDWV